MKETWEIEYEEIRKKQREQERAGEVAVRNALAQRNFDYRVGAGRNLAEFNLLNTLYGAGYSKSEAEKAIKFIYNQTEKALKN